MKLRDVVIGANASMYYKMDFRKIKAVFYPRSEQDVLEALVIAREKGYDVTPKGGGSGLSGACTGGNNERIMISSLQMKELLTISKDQGYIDVQPGATPDEINAILETIGVKLWVAPSSRDIATVGGILSTDGGGNDTWVNGTMRDNTLRAKIVLYDGRRITVDMDGVKAEDKGLEAALNEKGLTLHDIASAHGTLGFLTEMRLAIRPLTSEKTLGGLATFDNADDLGAALLRMIDARSPIRYGEVIAEAHPDVREDLKPPLLILEIPEKDETDLREIVDFQQLTSEELERMKDIRIKLPKRNPKESIQVALFEGYGFHDDSLRKMQSNLDAVNSLLREHGMIPFAKYGHGPSKWYVGDNSPTYGIILHSREIKPPDQTGREIYETVIDIVALCEKLRITPKPEHKWPFSDDVKLARIQELRKVIGKGFNSFIVQPDCSDVLSSMVP